MISFASVRPAAEMELAALRGAMMTAVDAIPHELTTEPGLARVAHLASGPVQSGSVKLTVEVVEKMKTAPLGGQSDFRSGDRVEQPLGAAGVLGIVLALQDARTLKRPA